MISELNAKKRPIEEKRKGSDKWDICEISHIQMLAVRQKDTTTIIMTAFIKRHKNFIPIILLALLSLWTIYRVLFVKFEFQGVLYDQEFSTSNYLAFGAVMINIFVYFFARKNFKYSVAITLALGLLSILEYGTSAVKLGVNSLSFNGISFLVGLLYLALNYRRVRAKFKVSEDQVDSLPDQEKIEKFKFKYRNDTDEELETLINDKRFVTEAQIAAKELLTERNKDAQQLT